MGRVVVALLLVVGACSSSSPSPSSPDAEIVPEGSGGRVIASGGALAGTGGRIGTGGASQAGGSSAGGSSAGGSSATNAGGSGAGGSSMGGATGTGGSLAVEPAQDGGVLEPDAQRPDASPLCKANDAGWSSCGDGGVTNLSICCFCESTPQGYAFPYMLTMQPLMCDSPTLRAPAGAQQVPPCTTWDKAYLCRSCSTPDGSGKCTP